jgi:regulator of protease activity HflC (stomatin/prohibitin superfamily)
MKSQSQTEADRRYKAKHRAEINQRLRESYAERYGSLITAERVRAEERQINPPPDVKRMCDCHDYRRCMICRNAEKRRAASHGEIPAYRLQVLVSIVAHGD